MDELKDGRRRIRGVPYDPSKDLAQPISPKLIADFVSVNKTLFQSGKYPNAHARILRLYEKAGVRIEDWQ